jgi:hypothetical protein
MVYILITAIPSTIGLVWLFIYSRNEEQSYKKTEEKLTQELSRPRLRIEFIIKTTLQTRYTEEFVPYIDAQGSMFEYLYTSEHLAKKHLETSYRCGYFKDVEGVTYPISNIYQARIVEAT